MIAFAGARSEGRRRQGGLRLQAADPCWGIAFSTLDLYGATAPIASVLLPAREGNARRVSSSCGGSEAKYSQAVGWLLGEKGPASLCARRQRPRDHQLIERSRRAFREDESEVADEGDCDPKIGRREGCQDSE